MEDAIQARRDLECANAALRESEARLRSLLNAMDEAFVVKEKVTNKAGQIVDWRYVEWNPAFLRHTGIDHPEGKTVRQLIPEIEPIWIERYAEVLRTGKSIRFQDRIAALDRWLDVFASRVGGPESGRIALVFTNITEKRMAEEALRSNEEQFRRAIQDAPIPVIMHTEDGQVLQISNTWTELSGYRREDMPTFDAWLNHACRDGADAVRKHVRRWFRGQKRQLEFEIDVTTRTGERRRWAFSASAPGTLRDRRRYIVGMAVDVTERAEELREANKELRALSQRLVLAQENERRHLARELHDEVGQQLTGLKMVLHRAISETGARRDKDITEAERIAGELLQRVRRLSVDLRPSVLDDLGLGVAIRTHVDTFIERTGIRVRLSCRDLPEEHISPEVKMTAFRAVQEALTNVARHAQAESAAVEVRAQRTQLHIEVRDAGKGFRPRVRRKAGSSGLDGMRERVALTGGQLLLETAPGHGTRVAVALPLNNPEEGK
jgi:PAS domain S-box-containing protein